MPRRHLPISIQTFREIREDDHYYVDKTGFALRLIEEGKAYFLSRPRRHAALLRPAIAERVAGADSDYIATDQVLAQLQALARRDPADWKTLIPEISALTDALLLLNANLTPEPVT